MHLAMGVTLQVRNDLVCRDALFHSRLDVRAVELAYDEIGVSNPDIDK